MSERIVVNGVNVVMSLELVTEPGEGWIGSQYLGEAYRTTEELNKAINNAIAEGIPVGWMLKVDFQDDEPFLDE